MFQPVDRGADFTAGRVVVICQVMFSEAGPVQVVVSAEVENIAELDLDGVHKSTSVRPEGLHRDRVVSFGDCSLSGAAEVDHRDTGWIPPSATGVFAIGEVATEHVPPGLGF